MNNKSFIITTLLLSMAIAGLTAIHLRELPVIVQTNLEYIPMQILGYTAEEDFFPQKVYDELNADKHIYRHYRSKEKDDQVIDLYIGYYSTKKGGRSAHNPNSCLPGTGWGIEQSEKVILNYSSKNDPEEVNYLISRKDDNYVVMLHWYQSEGIKVLDSGMEQNIYSFISRILYNKNDGAFIRISTNTRKETIQEASFLVNNFAEEILCLLPKYWPEER